MTTYRSYPDLVSRLNVSFRENQDKIAVIDGSKKIKYATVSSQIRTTANYLSELMVECERVGPAPLGLLICNTYTLVLSILGCISKGIPYIVLDPGMPHERLSFMSANSKIKKCITDSKKSKLYDDKIQLFQMPKLLTDHDLPVEYYETETELFQKRYSKEISYIIYTSGSTGKPKGIIHTWGEINTNIMWMAEEYPEMGPANNVLQLIPFHSDPSLRQLIWPLTSGASITLLSSKTRSKIDKWVSLITHSSTTDIFIVPNLLKCLLQYIEALDKVESDKISIQRVFCVGEPLLEITAQNLSTLLPKVKLYNQYGVSEISGNLTNHKWEAHNDNAFLYKSRYVPIGSLLNHVDYRVIDTNQDFLTESGVGNLAVRILDMHCSYIGDIEPGRFLDLCSPSSQATKFFLTGDQVRICENQVLAFVGRVDQQVKILGYRVELLEIEAVLSSLAGVKKCAVVHQKDSDASNLIAYIQCDDEVVEKDIRVLLTTKLPSYMVPSMIIKLDSFPELPNGKVDRVSLTSSDLKVTYTNNELLSCNSATRKVISVFKKVFSNSTITCDSNFFELGGNSLLTFQITQLLMVKFGRKIPTRVILNNPSVKELAGTIELLDNSFVMIDKKIDKVIAKSRTKVQEKFPLQPLQLAYILASGENIAIHDYLEFSLSQVNVHLLEESLNSVIRRHEMLRCVVEEEFQFVLSEVPKYHIRIYDVCDSFSDIESHLLLIRKELSHQIIDTSKFPSFDIRLTRTTVCDYLHLSFAGVFIDASSFQKVLQDWSYIYRNLNALLPPIRVTFSQYIDYVNEINQSDFYIADKTYWVDKLDNFPTRPELPLAHSKGKSIKFLRKVDSLSQLMLVKVNTLSLKMGVSINEVLLTAFANTIARFSSSKRFALNITLDNRIPIHPDVSEVIGNFTSTTLLEIDDGKLGESFKERVFYIKAMLAECVDHRLFTGVDVQRELITQVGEAKGFMFPIVFTSLLKVNRDYRTLFAGEFIETTFHITQTPDVWIDCKVYEDPRGLVIEWDYLDGIFLEGLVDSMYLHYVDSVAALIENDLELSSFQLFSEKQIEWVNKINDTNYCFEESGLHQLFFRNVKRRMNSYAIVAPGKKISYKNLSYMTYTLSTYLGKMGIKRKDFVGILLQKGWEQVVAALGILSCGATYVPLDPLWPKNRILSIIRQCNITNVITLSDLKSSATIELENHCKLIDIHASLTNCCESDCNWLNFNCDIDDVAYVIFTSGTTGVPKGVAVTHRSSVNTILDMNKRCSINETDKVFGLSELNFDLSVYDIFGILAAGGCLVLPGPSSKTEPGDWVSAIMENQVTLWNSVPALLQILADHLYMNLNTNSLNIDSLRWIWLSGDRIPLTLPDAIRRFTNSCQLLSLGGATEASIWSICFPIKDVNPKWHSIPYGKPLLNQRLYILDTHFEVCPVWVTGEIFIAGLGLSLGYWGDSEQTIATFIFHPRTKERIYRTGDYGRYMPDGNIEFLGRRDDQVKVNGFRIELDEIKGVLLQHYIVKNTCVLMLSKATPEIVAFVTTDLVENKESSLDVETQYNFKISQPGLRADFSSTQYSCMLQPRFQNKQKYLSRKSFRSFESEQVVTSEILTLLNEVMFQEQQQSSMMPLDLKALGRFLSPLSQLRCTGSKLPKYIYASAGNLYPVQVYLEIGENAIPKLDSGYYYYDPVQHQLILVQISKLHHSKTYLILVGKYSALSLEYASISESLMWLNAGYLLGSLSKSINHFSMSLENKEEKQTNLHQHLNLLSDDKVLLVLGLNTDHVLEDVLKPPSVYFCLKNHGSRYADRWVLYDHGSVTKSDRTYQDIYKVNLTQDAALMFGDCSAGIFFLGSSDAEDIRIDRLISGFYGHQLMSAGVKYGLGFCPIGNVTDVCLGSKSVVHALVCGKVSQSQLKAQEPSQIRAYQQKNTIADSLLSYASAHLPNHMIPTGIEILPSWPLTQNGKVDKSKLEIIWQTSKQGNVMKDSTGSDEITEFVLNMVRNILQIDSCGLGDNFYRLGGNSISAVKLVSRVRSRFSIDITVKDVMINPDLYKLMAVLRPKILSSVRMYNKAIEPRENVSPLPLTYSQKRLFFIQQLNPNSCEYNIPLTVRLKGEINLGAMTYAFNQILTRHQILKTRFYLNDEGNPVQEVCQNISGENLIRCKVFANDLLVSNEIYNEVNTPFDLSKPLLLRVSLLKASEGESVLVITQHHIISDGWSTSILADELSILYNEFLAAKYETSLPNLRVQYTDFCIWQSEQLLENIEVSLNYWKKELTTVQILELPTQKQRPVVFTNNGDQFRFKLAPELSNKLKEIALSHDTTLYCVLLSVTFSLLSKFSGQTDICIGSPMSSRSILDFDNLVGFFVNTVVHRVKYLDENKQFSELLNQVSETVVNSFQHMHCPLDAILESIDIDRDPSRTPLFQVMLALQNIRSNFALNLTGLISEEINFNPLNSKFDLTFVFKEIETTKEIECVLEYYSDIFVPEFIQELAQSFQYLAQCVTNNVDTELYQVSVTEDIVIGELLQRTNQIRTTNPMEHNLTICDVFEIQVNKFQNKLAIEDEYRSLTYQELDALTNCIAYNLLHVMRDDISQHVPIFSTNKFNSICLILGVLKTGKAYVVLDSELPYSRIEHVVKDVDAKYILLDCNYDDQTVFSSSNLVDICFEIIQLNDLMTSVSLKPSFPLVSADAACTIVYTSGTTGVPKGVVIPHRSITRLVVDTNYITFSCEDVVSQTAQLGFDASNFEVFGALLSGAKLLVISKENLLDTKNFKDLILRHRVTVLLMVTSLFNAKIEACPELFENLRVLLIGGEELCTSALNKLFNNTSRCPEIVVNAYGPTENGTISTTQVIDEAILKSSFVPIGKPILGSTCFVLDKWGKPVPKYVVGELYVGGVGLALGYLNRDTENKEKFIATPAGLQTFICTFLNGGNQKQLLYKTGDFASVLNDGSLRFHNRKDNQVKIRGYRVELVEVQSLLKNLKDVADAVVYTKKNGTTTESFLIACIVLRHGNDTVKILQEVESVFPKYMIPQQFVILDKIPQTVNGKVDIKQLDSIASQQSQNCLSKKSVETLDTIETWILDLWKSELKILDISSSHNFFKIGGHSLLAIRVLYKINLAWSVQISMKEFFASPTISELSTLIRIKRINLAEPGQDFVFNMNLSERFKPFPLLDIQLAYLIGRELRNKIAAHCYFELKYKLLDIRQLNTSLNKLIARQEMLRCVLTSDGQQKILPKVHAYELPCVTVSSDEDLLTEVVSVREQMSHQVLNLNVFPAFDIRISRSHSEVVIHLSFDGMFMDAMSLDIFFREWSLFYNTPDQILPELTFSFRDYVLYMEYNKRLPSYLSAKKYFMDRIKSFPHGPELPQVFRKFTREEDRFLSLVGRIPNAEWTRIKTLGNEHNISPTCILLTAYADVLARFSREKHFAINLTMFNRHPVHEEVNNAIGEFTNINLLEFNTDVSGCINFIQRCKGVQDQLHADLDHMSFSSVEFQRELVRKFGGSIVGLYPIVFTSLLNLDRLGKENLFNQQFEETLFCITQTPQVYIDCKVYEELGDLVIEWDHLDGVFPDGLVLTMHELYVEYIVSLSQYRYNAIQAAHDLTPKASLELIQTTNSTHYAFELCGLHELFFKKSKNRKDACAIVTSTLNLSYKHLSRLTSLLCYRLVDRGIQKKEFVGICLEKGWEQVVATLGILSCGAAYVPLDSTWPKNRILSIIKQCDITNILTLSTMRSGVVSQLENYCNLLDTDILLNNSDESCGNFLQGICDIDDVAYVIFTSGTTGVPKGVAVTHRSSVNTILDMNRRCSISETDKVLGLSELHFDLSVYDIFGILAAGGCLVLPDPSSNRKPGDWISSIKQNQVTLWNSVPAFLQMLTDYLSINSNTNSIKLESLRCVWLSGDRIPVSLPDEFRQFLTKSCQMFSLGGATEASIWSICYPIKYVNPIWNTIPYGKPLLNQRVYIFDEHFEICPFWVEGELFIAGLGLALGYWGDSERTKKSFVFHPRTGERIYRTGDYGRYMPDGNIEFIGRKDNQVKINGYRIELEEIKAVLLKHHLVNDAIVMLDGEKVPRIVAFVTSGSFVSSFSSSQTCYEPSQILQYQDVQSLSNSLSLFASVYLPNYMLPTLIKVLPFWPLTNNGKLDKNILEKFLENFPSTPKDLRVTPFNEFESILLKIWQKVLHKSVPLKTGFFDIGGSSLDALNLALIINHELASKITVAWVYTHQTITDQAKWLSTKAQNTQNARSKFITFNSNGSKPPIILVHPGRDSAFAYAQLSQELGEDQPIIALEYHNLFEDTNLDTTVEEIASRYISTLISLELNPPYIIGGWSFGGLVAFEISRQLQLQGKVVKQILMFDTPFPEKSEVLANSDSFDIMGIISEPEKQLYATLSNSAKKNYRRAAIVELHAIFSYEVKGVQGFEVQIVQFLPAASNPDLYTSWKHFCTSMIIEPIPGDHSSILREKEHRQKLVLGIRKFTAPKLIFIIVSPSVDYSKLIRLLSDHVLVALVNESILEKFIKQYGDSFRCTFGIVEGKPLGYLNGLDFEQCKLAIDKVICDLKKIAYRQNMFIVSSDESNVSLSSDLRKYFQLSTGPLPNQSLKFRDKIEMKISLQLGNIKVPKFIKLKLTAVKNTYAYYQCIVDELQSPFVLKPTNSGGGFGVYKIETFNEFVHILSDIDLDLRYEAEEFLLGELYHCDIALVANNPLPVFADCSIYFHPFMGFDSQHDCIGSTNAIDAQIADDVIQFCTKAVNVLGGMNGLFHCEVFRDLCTGDLTFLEAGSRLPGALIPKMYEKTHGITLSDLDILLQVNQCYNSVFMEKKLFGTWAVFFSHNSGTIVSVNEFKCNEMVDIEYFYKVGDYYDTNRAAHKVIGTLLFASKNMETVKKLCSIISSFKLLCIKEEAHNAQD